MSIYRITRNIPTATKLKQLNDMVMELSGYVEQGRFNKNEIDQIFDTISTSRKFLRDVGIGNTSASYVNWSHLKEETGYSIWKYTPTSYTYNSLNNIYFDGKKLDNRGNATSESATTFDLVYIYDSGDTTYVNDTGEAGTEGGTQFNLMEVTGDYLYLGEASKFGGSKFEFHTRGSNYTLKVEYWNGAWITMTADDNDLDESTNDFQGDGHINWTIPTDWVTCSINGESNYWTRVSTTTTPITIAKAYFVIPYSSVIGLLAMHSSEVQEGDWAWCSYSGSVYVAVKNSGNSSYEGDYYITSASSEANKENYFSVNHSYTIDHQSSLNDPCQEVDSNSSIISTDGVILADASGGELTLTLPAAYTREGMEFVIKKADVSENDVVIETESGELIDGSATHTLGSQYDFVRIVSDNANWYVIGGA